MYAQKNFPAAITAYKKALEFQPTYAMCWNNLGNALHRRGDLPGAIKFYEKALKFDPNLARAWYNLGIALYDQKGPAASITPYKKALEVQPNFAAAWYNLGNALYAQQDLPGASAAYERAVEIEPKLWNAWLNLGTVRRAQKELPGAITAFKKALELVPGHANGWNNFGNALRDSKDIPAAVAAFRKAIEIRPDHAAAWYNLGNALRSQKDLPGAIAAYKKAATLDRPDRASWNNLLLATRDQAKVSRLEKRLPAVLQGGKATVAEQLELADFCLNFRERYRDAARLYDAALAARPSLANDLEKGIRLQAAKSAVLAAAAQGKDGGKLGDQERVRLRKQALDWLQAELTLTSQSLKKAIPNERFLIYQRLTEAQSSPDFASVRGASLPDPERPPWQKLWATMDQLLYEARGMFTEISFNGQLTAKEPQHVHEVRMTARSTVVIDMRSARFDTLLRVEHARKKFLQENDDATADDENSRIIFEPKEDGVYRIVATSYQQAGRGAYVITVREFRRGKWTD